jgi:dolichyl-phosphate beta-glucosyltransferase
MATRFSLVIPAYNERFRLPDFLVQVRQYLSQMFGADYEVVVVDDGSQDGTADWLRQLGGEWPQLTVHQHRSNRGKGAAVQTGMLVASGDVRLFADADGAAAISEELRLRSAIEDGADVAIGSRLVRGGDAVCRRSWRRSMIGRLFAMTAGLLIRLPVRDTQCGFKMFRAAAAERLFAELHEQAFLFDLEVLILAHRLDYNIAEVAISWADQPDSRMSLWREVRRILPGLWRLRKRQRQADRSTQSED